MENRLRVARPSAAVLNEAWALWASAEFTECVRLLSNVGFSDPPEREDALLLRVRCMLRIDVSGIADALSGVRSWSSPSRRWLAQSLLGVAFVRTERAHKGMALLRGVVDSPDAPSLVRGEAAYQLALALWSEKRYSESSRILQVAFEHADPYNQVLARELDAWLYAPLEQYRDVATRLIQTFYYLKSLPTRYRIVEANILHSISIFAMEMDLPGMYQELCRADIAWTADLAAKHFAFVHQLAWCAALQGDFHGALRQLRLACDIAPTKPWKIMALVDRYLVAENVDGFSGIFAAEERDHICRLVDEVDWETLNGEERVALLYAAELLAQGDAAQASACLDRYERLPLPMSPLLAFRNDRRLKAKELYVKGLVARAQGKTVGARFAFEAAHLIWSEIGYEWRSALAALAASSIEKDEKLMARAVEVAAKFPRSWLSSRIARERGPAESIIDLPAKQREVLELALSGAKADEIALNLGKSVATVRVQLRQIYHRFGVSTRSQLILTCAGTRFLQAR